MYKNKKEISCPVELTLSFIENKWRILIIRELLSGKKRFGELKKNLGNISQGVLTSNLRDMEKSGLVIRKIYPEVPPRVEYKLTTLGMTLEDILNSMKNWGISYKEILQKKPQQIKFPNIK